MRNQNKRLGNNRVKLEKVQKFHKEMDLIIEQYEEFNFMEIMQFRNYILLTFLPKLSQFYLNNKDLKTEFDVKFTLLFDIQETKGAEFASNKFLAFAEEGKEEALNYLKGFDLGKIERKVQKLCQVRREMITKQALKGFSNQEFIEQFAMELHLGAFALFRKQSGKEWSEGLKPLKIRYEKITFFVINTILGIEDPKNRTKVYMFFLNVLENLSNRHDYYNGRAIMDALNDMTIERTLRVLSDSRRSSLLRSHT